MHGINGNATRDAEVHQTTAGKPVANPQLATNRAMRSTDGEEREETQVHTVICFDRLAEVTSTYVTEGKLFYVEGRLETRQFTDKEGRGRELPHIIASDIQFLSNGREANAEETSTTPAEEVNLDDLPF
jgi:single-strand DNA-binding protein